MWHACGTATATAFSKTAAEGVVGPDFKVIGAAGLRIVDASVLPIVPSTHPMGVIFIIAEMAADMIRAQG
jgi:choline dehydrogenase-like flavoprotein